MSISEALVKALKSFASAIPIIISVILLFGLFRIFVPQHWIRSFFTGNVIRDTLVGSILGSLFAGNAVNSYIIGGELLRDQVSLYAVTAFIVTWVTIGVVQFPAEASLLGRQFALKRNILSFILSIAVSIATVMTLSVIG